jgi:hypothetical protein
MTPALLKKLRSLIADGATVVGSPPQKSPSLADYPACDEQVKSIVKEIWGQANPSQSKAEHTYGKGKIIRGGEFAVAEEDEIYPEYEVTASLLQARGVLPDFESAGPVRYTHRTTENGDIYFIANRKDHPVDAECKFRTQKGKPELWDPLTAELRMLPEFSIDTNRTIIPMYFEPHQSFFVVFKKRHTDVASPDSNFPEKSHLKTLKGAWSVSFDPEWGGPEEVTFDRLVDWTSRPEKGIKYYSGIAIYKKDFDLPHSHIGKEKRLYIDLGEVKNMACIHLNGHDLGVLWTDPWNMDITDFVKRKENELKIEVANLWPNRLIGDQRFPNDEIKDNKWPEWLIKGEKRSSKRYSFATYQPYKKDSPLFKSGLLGPVTIQQVE